MNPTRTRSTRANGARRQDARPRVRNLRRGAVGANDARDGQYDLLTAALVGLAIGAGTTLLLRRGPVGERPLMPALRLARRGALLAGRGARFAWDRGVDAWERVPREEIEEHVRDYFESAKETIDDLVHSELKDLRRAIRRQREKIGL
ncbi:MAG: hypothetical protein ACRENU_12330, partial [Gemmatimonadaceae bacterium]